MICNGVLPIDNLRDWVTPVEYITNKIPKNVLSYIYKVNLQSPNKFITANHLLFAYSTNRGYTTGSGEPDLTKASRLILKDYCSGKILYCHLPEGKEELASQCQIYNQLPADFDDSENQMLEEDVISGVQTRSTNKNIKVQKYGAENITKESDLNKEFFGQANRIKEVQDEENVVDMMTQDDVIDLVAGKTVHGIKLNKEHRRE